MPDQAAKQRAMCTSKKRYGTYLHALQVAVRAAKRCRLLRVYECPFCAGFHLTHKLPFEDAKTRKEKTG